VSPEGAVAWTTDGKATDPDEMERVSLAVLKLARALGEHRGPPARGLLHHAFHDPEIEFRRRALEALLAELPRSFEAKEALPLAEQDPDPVIRFLAARHRGELETVRALLGEGLPEEQAAEAKRMLASRLAGGLSVAAERDGGLSVQGAEEGALAEPAPSAGATSRARSSKT